MVFKTDPKCSITSAHQRAGEVCCKSISFPFLLLLKCVLLHLSHGPLQWLNIKYNVKEQHKFSKTLQVKTETFQSPFLETNLKTLKPKAPNLVVPVAYSNQWLEYHRPHPEQRAEHLGTNCHITDEQITCRLAVRPLTKTMKISRTKLQNMAAKHARKLSIIMFSSSVENKAKIKTKGRPSNMIWLSVLPTK